MAYDRLAADDEQPMGARESIGGMRDVEVVVVLRLLMWGRGTAINSWDVRIRWPGSDGEGQLGCTRPGSACEM